MNSTFQTSESIKTIAQALMTFRSNVETIKKDGENPFFHSKYATLSNILNTIATPLENSGLVFAQFPDGENALTTILIHPESGEFMQSTFDMHIIKNDPQAMGSAITYARRYALGAILGLNIDEDDDGNKATPPQENKPYKANNDDNKPWLNKGTAEFVAAHKAILSGEYKISDVRKKYKVGKEVANLLTQTIDAN
jgi:hypothetical protein